MQVTYGPMGGITAFAQWLMNHDAGSLSREVLQALCPLSKPAVPIGMSEALSAGYWPGTLVAVARLPVRCASPGCEVGNTVLYGVSRWVARLFECAAVKSHHCASRSRTYSSRQGLLI
jgi:hypothetical protein